MKCIKCDKEAFTKGMCQKHYMREYREKRNSLKNKNTMSYLIIDLERSLLAGGRIYWKANKRGYTPDPKHAGIYSQKEAAEIALNDVEGLTALLVLDENFKKIIDSKVASMYPND